MSHNNYCQYCEEISKTVSILKAGSVLQEISKTVSILKAGSVLEEISKTVSILKAGGGGGEGVSIKLKSCLSPTVGY